MAILTEKLNQADNVFPFSPMTVREEAIMAAYLKSKKGCADSEVISFALAEVGAKPNANLGLEAIEIGAGLIVGKYAGGKSLPNWSIFDPGGTVDYSRAVDASARKDRRLFSILLLEINWADSGGGFSWPEQYRITWAPRQERWIVSGSVDTDELYGCLDFALGHFKAKRDQLVEKAGRLVVRHWTALKKNNEQPPWESVVDQGATSSDLASAWRKKVWPRDSNYYM